MPSHLGVSSSFGTNHGFSWMGIWPHAGTPDYSRHGQPDELRFQSHPPTHGLRWCLRCRRPLGSSDCQYQTSSNQQRRSHLWPIRSLLISADVQPCHQRLPCKERITSQDGDPRNTSVQTISERRSMQIGQRTVTEPVGASTEIGTQRLQPLHRTTWK